MHADGFGRTVALDAFRALVPVRHHAFGRQHVDGVVGHALHQAAELVFALAQRVLRRLAVGDVARDLAVADQGALIVANRIYHHAGPEAGAVAADTPAFGFEAARFACDGQ